MIEFKDVQYILKSVEGIEVEQNNEIKNENYIDGLLESAEYYPIYKEGIKVDLGEWFEIEFTYDESDSSNNQITSITYEGEELELDNLNLEEISNKLFNTINPNDISNFEFDENGDNIIV